MLKVFAMIAVLAALTASSLVYGEEAQRAELSKEKRELYQQLIEEGKKDGVPELDDITPENIEKLANFYFNSGHFENEELERKFTLYRDKITFVQRTGLYPTRENLIEVLFSDKYHPNSEKASAYSVLERHVQLEKEPSVEQVKKYLETINETRIIFNKMPPTERGRRHASSNMARIRKTIPMLAKMDKEEGFRFADEFMKDKDISLEDKIGLSRLMMEFEYTGGYAFLDDYAKSLDPNDQYIRNKQGTIATLRDYYSEYNGQFATNTDVIINTNQKSKKQLHREKLELYRQLIEEGKKNGFPRLENTAPEDIEKLTMMHIRFVDSENGVKFSLLQNQILFIKYSHLYPSFENVMKVALSEENDNIDKNEDNFGSKDYIYAQKMAFRILTSKYSNFEKDAQSAEPVKKYLENCNNIEVVVTGIPWLTKLDKEEGFRLADKIMNDEKVPLTNKIRLFHKMTRFEYTGGYVILDEVAKSDNYYVKYDFSAMMKYYTRHNGKFATNTEIVIDTRTISNEKIELYRQLIEEEKKAGVLELDNIVPGNIMEDLRTLNRSNLPGGIEAMYKFHLLQDKAYFIQHSDLYPTLENLINAALSDESNSIYAKERYPKLDSASTEQRRKDEKSYNSKIYAFRILASKYMPIEENMLSAEQVKKHLETCENIEFLLDGIPLLTKLDKEEGFRFADKIMNDENVPKGKKDSFYWSLHYSFGYTSDKKTQ